jgi:hypothetical protein
MYSVYLDESGHETGEHVVLAGYLGSEEQWVAFEKEWKEALGTTETFHIAKLRWNKDSTRRRLAKLGPKPHRHGLIKVIGAVKVSDYADLLQNMSEIYAVQGYHACLFPIIVEVLKSVPAGEDIRWVFEEQQDYEQQARNVFGNFPETDRNRLTDVSFVGKDATVRTQPADFLAYAMLQKRRDPQSIRAQWCEPIFSVDSFLGMIVGHDLIRKIVKESLDAAALLTTLQTGKDPRVQFASAFETKKEAHEAMKRAAAKRSVGMQQLAINATKKNPAHSE